MHIWLSTLLVTVLYYCTVYSTVVLGLPVRDCLIALGKYCQIICMMNMFSTVPELLRCVQLVQYNTSICTVLLSSSSARTTGAWLSSSTGKVMSNHLYDEYVLYCA